VVDATLQTMFVRLRVDDVSLMTTELLLTQVQLVMTSRTLNKLSHQPPHTALKAFITSI